MYLVLQVLKSMSQLAILMQESQTPDNQSGTPLWKKSVPPLKLQNTVRQSLTSNSLPVCMDQTNISKVSRAPAHTMSPLWSMVRQLNCEGLGEVNVRKLRYLKTHREIQSPRESKVLSVNCNYFLVHQFKHITCFGCSKEPPHWFWLRNKKINF